MFLTPYETNIIKISNGEFVNSKIKDAIERRIVQSIDEFKPIDDITIKGMELIEEEILAVTKEMSEVPIFTQPLIVNTDPISNRSENNRFVVDCRQYVGTDNNGMLIVKKNNLYKNSLVIAGLSSFWYNNGQGRLANISKFAVRVFTNWISGVLSSKLNLDELSEVRVAAIVAYYFCCLFKNFEPYNEGVKADSDFLYSAGIKVSYATGLKTHQAIEIIESISPMTDTIELIDAIKEHGMSTRLQNLNLALLITLISRVAMNGVPTGTTLVALEHPPTFIAMCYIAIVDRGYNKSTIGKIVHQMRNTQDAKAFVDDINHILSGK